MNISINLPDDIARQMENRWRDVPRRALEILVAEAYRSGVVTSAQVGRILGLDSRMEIDAFLKASRADLRYTEREFREDLEALQELDAR